MASPATAKRHRHRSEQRFLLGTEASNCCTLPLSELHGNGLTVCKAWHNACFNGSISTSLDDRTSARSMSLQFVGICSCNCFIRWVLILSRLGNRISPISDARCTGRQHSKKHSQTQMLLNEANQGSACERSMSLRSASIATSREILMFNQY